jgi:aryl-alcohol dehydrogenase-like predicted oxidoreductase
MTIGKRRLGRTGLEVSALGLGCMGMSQSYGTAEERDERESLATIDRSLELGVTFFDTAEVYGPFHNEELLGRALKGRRDAAVIATKFGMRIEEGKMVGVNSRPEHVREAVEGSLSRLGTDHIDLLYQHRVDPAVPIEDVVGAMAKLVRGARSVFWDVGGERQMIRRHAVHPIAASRAGSATEAKICRRCESLGIGPYLLPARTRFSPATEAAEDYPRRLPE